MSHTSSDKLIADFQQLTRISLDTQQHICQVCGQPLQEGDDLTAYVYRAAGEPRYEIGYIMCGTDCHEHPTVFTRGVREHVVIGHIGTCSDTRTQSTSPVLLDPVVVVTSPTTTAEPHVHQDVSTDRQPEHTPQRAPTPLLTAVREQPRPDGGPRDGDSA